MSALRLPQLAWPAPGSIRPFSCPQCGAPGAKAILVSVAWRTDDNPDRRNDVLACPACGAAFYDHLAPPDYSDPNIAAAGRAEFYLQQGTGLWSSASVLARLGRPPGSRYLEVGCGFGFGLDFAIHGLGWEGEGYDPSPVAEIGRVRLGLPIVPEYFTDAPAGSKDVILAAEVIEHLPSPRELLVRLGAALAGDGVLVLTTPDAACIRPDTSSGALIPLLSPGLHLLLQTQQSLTRLLHECGFSHVEVRCSGCSLIAFAARVPLKLSADPEGERALYRRWLIGRATRFEADRSLFFAFAGHAFSESVNDADYAAARSVLPALAARLGSDFSIDLDRPGSLSPELGAASLVRLTELMPLNLPAMLIARAFLRLAEGEARVPVRTLFVAAGVAGAALRRALAERMLEDGETEALSWVAAAEILLSDAEAGCQDLPERLAALPAAPGGGGGAERRRSVVQRCFTGLVNAGQIGPAEAIAAAEGLREEGAALLSVEPLSASERDLLFSLGVAQLHDGKGDAALAARLFARVRTELAVDVSGLYWASLRGEALAIARMAGGEAAARALIAAEFAALGSAAAGAPQDLKERAGI